MNKNRARPRGTTVPTHAGTPTHDYEPRYGIGIAALVYAAGTLMLAWPALLGQFLVNPRSDQYVAGYAFREFAATMLRTAGRFPLWNPYQFGGMPYVAAMHGDIFYPTFLLRMLLPTDVAMTWGMVIHVFLAGLFAFVFLRRVGFGFFGSLIGGIGYMMGGQVASMVSPGHDGKLFVSALFPLLLWALVAGVRDGRSWAWGAVALIVGLDVLSPHPQLLQYSLLAGGAYAVFLAVRASRRDSIPRGVALRRLGFALGGVILGLAIGAVQYLPVREYVAWSPRAGGIGDYARATSYAWNPQELFNVYLPQFTGILSRYWGPNGIQFQSQYVGVVLLMLAGAAFVGMRDDVRRSELWFWTGAIVIAVLWALGGATPFYRIPFYLVPGTRYFRAPDTILFVFSMGIAVLVATGVERVLAGRISVRYAAGWVVFALLVALLATAGGLTNVAQTVAPPGVAELVDANSRDLTVGAWRALFFVLGGAALIAAAFRRQLSPRLLGAGFALLAAVDLWSILRLYWLFSPPASQLYASTPAIEFLRAQPQPARVVAVQIAPGADRALFGGAGLMTHDVRNALGYHGNEIGRYDLLVGNVGAGEALQRIVTNPNVAQLTNTQFILTNAAELGSMIPGLQLAFRPGPGDTTGQYVFRLPVRAPYAWVAPVIVRAPDDAVLATVLDPRFDVTRAALFDSAAPVTGRANVTTLPEPSPISVKVDRYEPGRVTMTLSAPAPAGSALVVSENFYPGWTASVDGARAAIGRAQFSLIGAELPAGARRVELAFTSPAYERGKVVTLVALLAAVGLLVAGTVAERRRGA